MDKTTTWLVRGASLIIIFVGFIFLKPYFQIQEQIRINDRYEKENREANERCKQRKEISYRKLLDLINSGQVTKIVLSSNNGLSEVKTKNESFSVSIAPDKELLDLFTENNIDITVGSFGLCKWKKSYLTHLSFLYF